MSPEKHTRSIELENIVKKYGGIVHSIARRMLHDPEKINADPYGDGWIVRMQPSGDDGETMDPDAYQALLDQLDE